MRFSTFIWVVIALGFLFLAVLMWIAGIWIGDEVGQKFAYTGGVLLIPGGVAGVALLSRWINDRL